MANPPYRKGRRSLLRILARLTFDPDIPLNTIADNDRWTSSRAGDIDILQMDIGADGVRRAGQIRHYSAVLPG